MKQKELRRARSELADGSPEDRQRKGVALVAKAESSVQNTLNKLVGVARDYRNLKSCWTGKTPPADETPHSDPDSRARAHHKFVGAIAGGLFETGLGAAVCSRGLNFPPWVAAFIGAVVAVILSLIAKATLLRFYDPAFPVRSYEIIRRWIMIMFVICIAAIFPLLAARTLGGAAILVAGSLTVLAVALPTLAGALLAAGFILNWPQRLTKEFDALTEELLETRRFLAENGPEYAPEAIAVPAVVEENATQPASDGDNGAHPAQAKARPETQAVSR